MCAHRIFFPRRLVGFCLGNAVLVVANILIWSHNPPEQRRRQNDDDVVVDIVDDDYLRRGLHRRVDFRSRDLLRNTADDVSKQRLRSGSVGENMPAASDAFVEGTIEEAFATENSWKRLTGGRGYENHSVPVIERTSHINCAALLEGDKAELTKAAEVGLKLSFKV